MGQCTSLIPLHFGYRGHPQNLPRYPVRKTIGLLHADMGQMGGLSNSATDSVLLLTLLPI